MNGAKTFSDAKPEDNAQMRYSKGEKEMFNFADETCECKHLKLVRSC